MRAGAFKAIKLKRKIVQKRLQKYPILSGIPPAKISQSAPATIFIAIY